jgi:hypothetical protein
LAARSSLILKYVVEVRGNVIGSSLWYLSASFTSRTAAFTTFTSLAGPDAKPQHSLG